MGGGFDRGEGEAVEGGGAEGDEGAEVLRGGVPLVRGEAVAGMRGVERADEAVAVDLGDNGGGGDGEGERVAVDELGLRAGVGQSGEIECMASMRRWSGAMARARTAESMARRVAW